MLYQIQITHFLLEEILSIILSTPKTWKVKIDFYVIDQL